MLQLSCPTHLKFPSEPGESQCHLDGFFLQSENQQQQQSGCQAVSGRAHSPWVNPQGSLHLGLVAQTAHLEALKDFSLWRKEKKIHMQFF